MDICCTCSRIPFQDLFGNSREPRQWKIGDLNHARSNRSACRFCSFLVEAYELAYDLPREHLAKHNKNARHGFQIPARDKRDAGDGEEPWFERLGITIEDPQMGPALWLQFNGVQENCRELPHPFVCISCTPAEKQPGQSTRIIPRQRTLHEVADRRVNYVSVNKWLGICVEEHDGLCRKGTPFQHKFLHSRLKFRLIDVNRGKIVVVNKNKQHVALSYVWGKVMKEKSASFWCNAASNATHIGLPDEPPRTVEDAITFTKSINCKYLWADAYCINQTDQRQL